MLSIGTVAGATVDFTVYKNLAQVLQYAGYPCNVYYKFKENEDYLLEGMFTITEINENGLNKTTITAFDSCRKLDRVIYPLLSRITYPISLAKLFTYICAYCSIPYNKDYVFPNSSVQITSSFGDYKTTCREVVE